MPNNDLAIRFTEEKYATKSEVSRELKTSLIDTFWNNIISYRSNFYRSLTIKSIERHSLFFCACSAINGKVMALENRLLSLNRDFYSLLRDPGEMQHFVNSSKVNLLLEIAKADKIDASAEILRPLVRGDAKVDEEKKNLNNYLNALEYIKTYYANKVDEDFLSNLYCKLLGTEELISFYRLKDDSNPDNRVVIDRIYTCAPAKYIEEMMNSLFTFLQTTTLNATVKALVTIFYITYIRPFDKYSEEIGILLAKSLLAHDSIGEMAIYLPLERMLNDDKTEINKLFAEVQKNDDITYFVNYAMKTLDGCISDLLDTIAKTKGEKMREDFYRIDKEEVPTYIEVQEKVVEKQIEVQEEVKENNIPVTQNEKPVAQSEELAVSYIPPAIDEKEAQRLETHLLESDPSLRKGEAKFFARHCVKGKRYTIQQYKKALGCAYETARSSMEHLVELGYYKKEQVKNKFVYTPICR